MREGMRWRECTVHVGELAPSEDGVGPGEGDSDASTGTGKVLYGIDRYASVNPDRVADQSVVNRTPMLPVNSGDANGPRDDWVWSPDKTIWDAAVPGKSSVTKSK